MSIKAFELVPTIERTKLLSDRAKTQIECIECCGKNLYIGTSDCFVVHYIVDEQHLPNGKTIYDSVKQGHKYLGLPIVTGAKVKGVTAFCLNQNPISNNPFSVEICVALRKKLLQIYTVTEDRLNHVKDVATQDPPVTMSMDGTFVCAALSTQYSIVNYDTANSTDLFPYDSEAVKPFVQRISKEEFLLSGPSGLGMFVTTEGVSQRPPLQWSESVSSYCYVHPYIVALDSEFITVHSILDQQQKQSIPYQGGIYLDEYEGRVFIASLKEIYALVPIAWEKQVTSLLADRRVSEALALAKNAKKVGLTREQFQRMYRRLQQQAGFIEFAQQHFDECRELFKTGRLDVRELISLYPFLMPQRSSFTRSVPSLHDIADVRQLARNDATTIKTYKEFLMSYLEENKADAGKSNNCCMEIDTALLKLYAELDPSKLLMFIGKSVCKLSDCVELLEKHERFHALGLLYRYNGQHANALQVWKRLTNGEVTDVLFPGLEYVVQYLSSLSDHTLVWQYTDWIIQKDECLGVQIFTNRPANETPSDKLQPDNILDQLHRYPRAVITYLEYLVFQKKSQKEKYHTHLAVLYLDNVFKLLESSTSSKENIDRERCKLRHMLQTSNLYRVQLLLGKVKETDMYAESAILYGKLGDHDKAIRILVHKLKDFGQAENYCILNSKGKDSFHRKQLFHTLLSVYLDPSYERRDLLVTPAVNLLNNNQGNFDATKVLQLIPDNWSIGLLQSFLASTVRKHMHDFRTTRLQRMLSRGENLIVKKESIESQREALQLVEEKSCAVCDRSFDEPTFIRYPNGIITHTQCAKNKHVCPVTGKLFSTTKRTSAS
ncbi:unnamed protein product [Owenia fusiformis]|uniref:Uncharacterized protein n=1 Tax=Owenia fusiformis TaxID=6347 RepID=A0A8J1XV78_OWEFU|nr:unnamed protein product [Owenia fusiformis]